jgi:heme/copper-type cytochrome/quinol oxidase subunit 2
MTRTVDRRSAGLGYRAALGAGGLASVLLTSAGARADGPAPTPSIFAPASTPAFAIRELAVFVLGLTGVIFLVVAGLGVYVPVRFRRRRGDDRHEPPQVYGSRQIEMAWTVVPLLIIAVLFLVTARYIYGLERRQPLADAVEVTVIGHQWWWEVRYPKLGVVTANELHVPVSDPAHPTPTFVTLQSADVVHSFWIPQLAGKMDVIPNRTNRTWIEPQVPGEMIVRKDGRDLFLATGEGLIEVTARRVAILTDLAVPADRIDEAKAEEARRRAEARLREKLSNEEVASVNASLARSLAQLRVKRRRQR